MAPRNTVHQGAECFLLHSREMAHYNRQQKNKEKKIKIFSTSLASKFQLEMFLPVDQTKITEHKQALHWPLFLVNKLFHLEIMFKFQKYSFETPKSKTYTGFVQRI